MNRRRQLLRAIGLGPLFAGVTAVVPCEGLAANGKSSTAPTSRPEYKVVSLPAGDRIEDILNAFARQGFQYAGSAQRFDFLAAAAEDEHIGDGSLLAATQPYYGVAIFQHAINLPLRTKSHVRR